MAGLSYLYRRSSGIYVVRVCVPHRLRGFVGKGELHVTTKTREPNAAKAVAFRIMAHWQGQILRGDMDVLTIAAGSPLLTGEGVILVADAAAELGLSRSEILTELLNVRAELLCRADRVVWFCGRYRQGRKGLRRGVHPQQCL